MLMMNYHYKLLNYHYKLSLVINTIMVLITLRALGSF